MKRIMTVLLMLAVLALPMAAAAAGTSNATDGPAKGPRTDQSYALVQLKGEPLTTSDKTRPAPGKKIDFNNSAVKAYRAQLAALRNDFKSWLRANAPKAKVTGEFDISLNAVSVQLNGETLAKIGSAPQVQRVEHAGVYYPTAHNDPDLAIINAAAAWTQGGGEANAGAGVKVAIVDSGIDISHPCFSDAGYRIQTQLGDPRFTNNKVIAAKVFNNWAGNRGLTPQDFDGHGSHVAGTVACNYHTTATVDGVKIPYGVSGVAPKALLGNYNVFPGDVGSARSEDILNALDAAYADGFDVANMSLGGGASGIQDLLTTAVDNLDQANMVVAVSAGNEGPGYRTVGSPGSAARALTAGASTVPHFVGTPVTVNEKSYGAAAGDFATVQTDLTAPLGVVTTNGALSTACAALPANSLSGKIAVISRGACTFSQKIRSAQDAGAVAAIVVNNVAGDPTAMGLGGIPNEPTIPAYMVSLADKANLIAVNGQRATISSAMAYFPTSNVDIMAGFSSQGPTDVDFRVKPDVVAPGVNVLSAQPSTACDAKPCWAFFQGTSMAAPHLAGSAAIVKQQHPAWSAAQVRSAIVNTADQNVLKSFADGTTKVSDVNIVGAGRGNLLSAVNATVALDPVSLSFGAIPAGAGQTKSFTLTVSDLTGKGGTYPVSITEATGSGLRFTTSASSVTVPASGSATVTVTMTADKAAGRGDHQATLTIGSSHAMVYTFVK